MKFIKNKSFWLAAVVCLLPIFYGASFWERLPEEMAIHFNVYGEPDHYESKGFVVFGIPVFMVLLQGICCWIYDRASKTKGKQNKAESVGLWIIPCVTVVLYVVTIGFGLGWNIDIRKVAALIVGSMFLVMGNYLPKLDYIKHFPTDTHKARKINRFLGYETVILGVLFILSLFLPPMGTVICMWLLIPYILFGVLYGILVVKKQ